MAISKVLTGSVAIAACIAGLFSGCQKPKPTPPLDDLKAALERSAEKELAAPSLATELISVPAVASQAEAEAARVLHLATQAGGIGLRSDPTPGGISILATIPQNNAEAFKAALQHKSAPMDKPSGETTLIEVRIAAPTPSPTP